MDEAEWLACKSPRNLYIFFRRRVNSRLKPVRRRFLLYACACCRQIWHLFGNDSKKAVELTEQYADGRIKASQQRLARPLSFAVAGQLNRGKPIPGLPMPRRAAHQGPRGTLIRAAYLHAAHAVSVLSEARVPSCALVVSSFARQAFRSASLAEEEAGEKAFVEHGRLQSSLFRDVIGNPFHPLQPRSFPAHVIGLAQSCCAAFPTVSDEFLILADALEELGENTAAAHCREKLHVKGCHLLDWILGGV